MALSTVRLQRREEVAHGTLAFHFDKPPGFAFRPGQAIDLVLGDPGLARTDSGRHAFSIVSAPHEERLVIATRMRASAYKEALTHLPIGGLAEIDGPFGSLTLHNKADRAGVFIAGGIGVTPFMSMLRHAAHVRLPHRLVLVYSNRRPEDSAFLAELQRMEGDNPHFQLVATMTDMERSSLPWTGERAMVDDRFLRRVTAELPNPICYVAGPPAMVGAMRDALARAGIDEDDIRSEDFYGY